MDKIRRYYNHAGSVGYSQANDYYHELQALMKRAADSKNDKNDVIVIRGMVVTADRLMEEMKTRKQGLRKALEGKQRNNEKNG
jgi:hypothetical protein